jgi:hypothetical protein|tara:strand:- start:856 stop:1881 length:1026 start_codon:yes stop_codon:yes gene_type:complete
MNPRIDSSSDDARRNLAWLYENAGPIIRWRLVSDFGLPVAETKKDLASALVKHPDVQRWLGNVGSKNLFAGGVHGSKDVYAGNAMGKLYEYGVRQGMIPELDDKVHEYFRCFGNDKGSWSANLIAPFIIGLGYVDNPTIKEWFSARLDSVHEFVTQGEDIYLSEEEMKSGPKSWQGKRIFRTRGDDPALPSSFEFMALGRWPHTKATRSKSEKVISFLCDPDAPPGKGYVRDAKTNAIYATGMPTLRDVMTSRILMTMEVLAIFDSGKSCPWFKKNLADFEDYRSEDGRYLLPKGYMNEKRDSYYLYMGAHMGLGENRRTKRWVEIESTFRVMNISRLLEV